MRLLLTCQWPFETASPSSYILVFLLAFLGCELTAIFVNLGGMPPVATSATIALMIVGLGLLFGLPDCASLAGYSGTFAGMGLVLVDHHKFLWLTALSLIAANVIVIFYFLQQRSSRLCLPGVGGRLGFFALVGFSTFSILVLWRLPVYQSGSFDVSTVLNSIFGMVNGATTTTELRRFLRIDSVHHNVLASAVVGIVGSTFLVSGCGFGQTLAATIYAGSFIGMSTLTDLRSNFILLSSVIASVVLCAAGSCLPGWGGLLGSAAACGVLAAQYLAAVTNRKRVTVRSAGAVMTAGPRPPI